jgi:MarC family integral membrane protein
MVQIAKSVLLIVSALFPIVNPIGGGPVFLSMTRNYPAQKRRALARSQQLPVVDRVIHNWIARALILWDISAGRADRRRSNRDCDGVVDAEAEG